MNPKQVSIFAAVFTLLLGILACTLPVDNPPSPEVEVTIITKLASPLPTNTKKVTATPLPTLDPDDPLTFGGAATATATVIPTKSPTGTPTKTPTRTPTKIPTITPTNTIPAFDEVLTFAVGGGGEFCGLSPQPGIAMSVEKVSLGGLTLLCFQNIVNPPLQLNWYDPNGNLFVSTIRSSSSEYFFWWPVTLSPGNWRIEAYGDGFSASSVFRVEKPSKEPHIFIFDPNPDNIIGSGGIPYGDHLLRLSGKDIDIRGMNFPRDKTIYVLIYRSRKDTLDFDLIYKERILSNSNGSFSLNAPEIFEIGQSYLLVGVSDPNISLKDSNYHFNARLPYEYFRIAPSTSCPGAPPQRMVVNQRGYVCTQSDNVRLRNAPKRSGAALDSLPVGTQFKVLDGPSCADNWSWWQIRTDSGVTGWIAEGGDNVDPYFICPLP